MAKAKVVLKVDGMTCQGCVRSVETKLSGLTGVADAHADLAAGTAAIEYDDARVDPPRMIAAVEQIGFQAQQQ